MEAFSVLLALYAGNSLVTAEFPSQRLVTQSFDLHLEESVEQTIKMLVIWDAIAPIMTSL